MERYEDGPRKNQLSLSLSLSLSIKSTKERNNTGDDEGALVVEGQRDDRTLVETVTWGGCQRRREKDAGRSLIYERKLVLAR